MDMRIDVHQHLWTEALIEALSRRRRPPYVRRTMEGWSLRLEGEPTYTIENADVVPNRTQLLAEDGVDLALVTPSLPLGIEALGPGEALPLLRAYEKGVEELPAAWRAWGTLPLAGATGEDVDALLDRGFVGLCLPATALATPSGIEQTEEILTRLERRGAPLFVHPGAAPAEQGDADEPAWWPAMTSYIAQMNAAWHAYVEYGLARHPDLRVLFAMLAGGAPLHLERLSARGGPRGGLSDRLFYETSSYGPRALRAMSHWVGSDQLVYGSDRPLATPRNSRFGLRRDDAMRRANTARLLGEVAVAA